MARHTVDLTEEQENGLMLYALTVAHPLADPPPADWLARLVRDLATRDRLAVARVRLVKQVQEEVDAAIDALRAQLTGDER